jgi:hypothetical protein
MRRPRCQHDDREGRRFCAHCGAPLALACPTCGFVNEPGEKFCGGCGIALAGPAPAPDSPLPPRASDPEPGASVKPAQQRPPSRPQGRPKPPAKAARRRSTPAEPGGAEAERRHFMGLFIVEDLHRVDSSTLELLGFMIDQLPTTRILTMLTCWPDFCTPSRATYLFKEKAKALLEEVV